MLYSVSVYVEIFINMSSNCLCRNLFKFILFAVCFVMIFTDKLPLIVCTIREFIQIYLIL